MAHEAAGRGAAADVAARAESFGGAAADYERARPGYPASALQFVLGDAPLRVLDAGAGTGKLTRTLIALGHRAVAADPSAQMLAHLSAALPTAETHVAPAEQLPLPDNSVDAVVAGQAYHWFDPQRALPEFVRVLRPGGVLGLLWNVRDESQPWVREFGALVGGAEDGTNAQEGDLEPPDLLGLFETPTLLQVAHGWPFDGPDELVALAASRSWVITRPEPERRQRLDRVRELAAGLGDVRAMPYICQTWRAGRGADSPLRTG